MRERKLQEMRSGWVRLRSKDKGERVIKDPLLPNGKLIVPPGENFMLPAATYHRHMRQLAWAENLDVMEPRAAAEKAARAKARAEKKAAEEAAKAEGSTPDSPPEARKKPRKGRKRNAK